MTGVALFFAALRIISSQLPTAVPNPVAPVPSSVSAEPGSNLTVYLLTMGPGDQVWEKFGHNAIWIHDSLTGQDIAYHWGLFDFADEDFLPRFIQGRMRYSMGAFDMEQTVDAYRQANRTVWAQELNFAPAERQKLADFVAWNMLPANRYYAYDYFRDNCSTRVRDALDNALGGAIKMASGTDSSNATFRFHTARLTQNDWAVFTGTMIGLGQPTDRPITAWEEMFLPVRMKDELKKISLETAQGIEPLVKNERVVVQATRPPEKTEVERGIAGYLAIATGILIIGAGLMLLPGRKGAALALAALWNVVAGIAGIVLAFLWGFTDHLYSYSNLNVFLLNPLSLLLAVFLVRAAWIGRKRPPDVARKSNAHALRVATYVAAIATLGFVIQLIPGFDQANAPVIALALPLHLGVLAVLILIVHTGPANRTDK